MSDNIVSDNIPQSLQRVMTALEYLKHLHAALLKSLLAHPTPDSNRLTHNHLPVTAEQEEQPDHFERRASPRLTSPILKLSRRSSISTNVSDTVYEWFDALEGAEEFVMDAQITLEGSEPSSHLFADTRSAVSYQEDSGTDTDIEENGKPLPSSGEGCQVMTTPPNEASAVVRRAKLPASPAGDEGSLFAILKKNIGKVDMF